MKIPRSRIAAREVLLAAVQFKQTIDWVEKMQWERAVPPIIWRDELANLCITVDADGYLFLPANVVVMPPRKEVLPRTNFVPGNAA
jgi:hypothetical protein